MSDENALSIFRWHRVWCLLSLEIVQEFRTKLWLDFLPQSFWREDSIKTIRRAICKNPSVEEYPMIHYILMQSVCLVHGWSAGIRLSEWQESVLIDGGDDRVPETLWNLAILERSAHQNSELATAIAIFTDDFKSTSSEIEYELSAKVSELSRLDRAVLRVLNIASEDLESTLHRILLTNCFSEVYERKMSDLSQNSLMSLYATGKSSVERKGLSMQYCGFPGDWSKFFWRF